MSATSLLGIYRGIGLRARAIIFTNIPSFLTSSWISCWISLLCGAGAWETIELDLIVSLCESMGE